MKKIFVLFLIIAVFLSACNTDSNTEEPVKTEPSKIVMGQFTQDDLIFSIDGEEFYLDHDVAPLLLAFGEDYTVDTAPSCVYDGEDKVFYYDFATIFTYPTDGKDMIDELFIFGGEYKTNKDITFGSTLEEVKAAYGDGGYLEGSTYFYVLSGDVEDLESPKLFFDLSDDNTVVGISYYAASNIT